LYRQPCPIVERQRPAPKACVARYGIILVDVAQDGVFELSIGEILGRTDQLLSTDALAQGVASDERRLCGVPDAGGAVVRRRHHALAVGAETGAPHRTGMSLEQRDLLAAVGVPDAGGVVTRPSSN
jgi:hypothetical protein